MRLVLERHQIDKLRKTYERSTGTDRQLAQVVLLLNEGWTQSKIAKALNMDVQNVISYLQEYLKPKHPPLRKRLSTYRLLPEQESKLVAHIEKNPHLSVRGIIEYIEQNYGDLWTEAAVQLFLKKNNFSCISKQVLHCEVITRKGEHKPIYRSVRGWFKNNATGSNDCTSNIAPTYKAG